MAISDLTGTVWELNSQVSTLSSAYNWDITCQISYTWDGDDYSRPFERINATTSGRYRITFVPSDQGDWLGYNLSETQWQNETEETLIENIVVSISGGTDATNATLIAWLEANATQVLPEPTVVYDLDNLNLSAGTYTITVKAKATGYADSINSNSISYTILP